MAQAQANEHHLYKCDNCKRIIYNMETGRGGDLKCCDEAMKEMSEVEKKPYHPRFPKPGSP